MTMSFCALLFTDLMIESDEPDRQYLKITRTSLENTLKNVKVKLA